MIVSFLRFWWSFVVGDDWRVAAAVALGVAGVLVLAQVDVHAWWLLPAIVVVALVGTLRSAARSRGSG
jgi:hypothetical protein